MTEQQALDSHARGQELEAEGRHQEALAQFDLAAAYFSAADADALPDLANVLADRAECLLNLCRYDEAELMARRGKEIVDSLRDLLHPDTRAILLPRAYTVWGRTLRELGRYAEAEAPLRAAIAEAGKADPADSDALTDALNEFGVFCKYTERFDEGELSYRRALDLLEKKFGVEAPQTASLYHNLGGLEHARGNFAKGEPLARKAYEIRRRELTDDDARTVADAVAWAGLLDRLERFAESVPIYRWALLFYESRLGPEHFEVAATLNNLGMVRAVQGDMAEARDLLARSLAIKRKLFGADHPEVRLAEENLEYVRSLTP